MSILTGLFSSSLDCYIGKSGDKKNSCILRIVNPGIPGFEPDIREYDTAFDSYGNKYSCKAAYRIIPDVEWHIHLVVQFIAPSFFKILKDFEITQIPERIETFTMEEYLHQRNKTQ